MDLGAKTYEKKAKKEFKLEKWSLSAWALEAVDGNLFFDLPSQRFY